MCVHVCVFDGYVLKVFVNPLLDSDVDELLISASILIRLRLLKAAL